MSRSVQGDRTIRKSLKIVLFVLLTPLIGLSVLVILRGCMGLMEPTHDQIIRDTHARTLADVVCRTDAYTKPSAALVTQMIDRGEDVNQLVRSSTYGQPKQPLLASAAECGAGEIVALLIERGARVDDAGLGNVVVLNGYMARLLVDHGASLTVPWKPNDPKRGTQLIQAAVIGEQPWLIERILAEQHADVQVVDGYGHGLLALALASDLRNRCRDTCITILKQLLAANAHVNPLVTDEAAPLVLAAKDGNTTAMQLLLDAGAKIEASMPSIALDNFPLASMAHTRATALTAAIYNCNVDAVRLLLQAGAQVPERGVSGLPVRVFVCRDASVHESDRPDQAEILALIEAATARKKGSDAEGRKPSPLDGTDKKDRKTQRP